MPISNYSAWQNYTRDLESPQSYIDIGFYWMISAALQRRVWYGTEGPRSLFPNQYILFTGPPGVGKGRVIKEVQSCLRAFYYDGNVLKRTPPEMTVPRRNYMFPQGPDSVTLEKLTQIITECARVTDHVKVNEKGEFTKKGYYHASIAFTFEELSSAFRSQAEDLVRFFTQIWDSGDYEKDTKVSGTDNIKKSCVSILAACTPKFMKSIVQKNLGSEGFNARVIIAHEEKNRFKRFDSFIAEDQITDFERITEHLLKLSTVCGEAIFTPMAKKKLETWYEKKHDKEATNYPNLEDYFSRKKVHVIKMCMATHFAESTSLIITEDAVDSAFKLLSRLEPNMDVPYIGSGGNPIEELASKIMAYLQKEVECDMIKLKRTFSRTARIPELFEAIQFLIETKQVMRVKDQHRVSLSITPTGYEDSLLEKKPPVENFIDIEIAGAEKQ